MSEIQEPAILTEESAVVLSKTTVDLLGNRFGDAIWAVDYFRDETTIEVDPGRLLEICSLLRDHQDLRYNLLADLCGLDRLDLAVDGPRFAVVYNLYSIPHQRRLRLKTCVDGDPPSVDSVTSLWISANWHEREAFDLVGIEFKGHSHLERILTPEGFEGHPHRRDFDTGNEPVQFTDGQQYVRTRHETTIEQYVDEYRNPESLEPSAREESDNG